MKYLIDKQMYDAIVWMLPDATPIKEMVSALKPIEPLGETDVFYNDKIMSNSYMPMSVIMELVRVIEAHILGEKHDS